MNAEIVILVLLQYLELAYVTFVCLRRLRIYVHKLELLVTVLCEMAVVNNVYHG